MDKLKVLKYGLLIFFFLLIHFDLNDYIENRPLVFPEKDKKPMVSTVFDEKIISSTDVVRGIKKKKVNLPLRVAVPELLDIPQPILDVTTSVALFDIIDINRDLQKLSESIHHERLKIVKKFYIPPVDYDINFKKLILPITLVAAGAITSQTDNYRDFGLFSRPSGRVKQYKYDDILQYVVPSSLFIFDIFDKEKHHPIDQFLVMAMAYGMVCLEVPKLKKVLREDRPDGGIYSFPSGHTAVAFVGAHMIYKEFKDSNKWIAYSGYTMAAAVGIGRMINNKHWLSDVVGGAGFAILSTELSYMIYFPLRNLVTNEANNIFGKYLIVTPVLSQQAIGLQVNYSF